MKNFTMSKKKVIIIWVTPFGYKDEFCDYQIVEFLVTYSVSFLLENKTTFGLTHVCRAL